MLIDIKDFVIELTKSFQYCKWLLAIMGDL